MTDLYFPIVISPPTTASGNGIMRVILAAGQFATQVRFIGATGHLKSLTSGTFQVDLVRMHAGGTVIGSLVWTNNGQQTLTVSEAIIFDSDDDGVRIDMPTIGTGAATCTITLWFTGIA